MRYVLMLLALLAVACASAYGQDLRQPPAPDDLSDPDLIELDLDAIVAEKEKLLSVSFTMGYSQKDLGTSEQQAVSIASIKSIFDALAAEFEAATGIDVSWRKDSFEEFTPAFNFEGNVRYKLPESIEVPRLGGRVGVDVSMGRVGSAARFSETGFGAAITDEAWVGMATALYYLPFDLSRFGTVGGVERRDLYVGIGAGRAWAKHSVEIYLPSLGLQGIGDYFLYEATGTAMAYQFVAGGDEFLTPFLSLNYQAGYRWLEKDRLKYNDLAEIEDSVILMDEGEIATTWGTWIPPNTWPLEALTGGAIETGYQQGADPIAVDFSGFLFRVGLSYHF